jgi:hypothetical protein
MIVWLLGAPEASKLVIFIRGFPLVKIHVEIAHQGIHPALSLEGQLLAANRHRCDEKCVNTL